MTAQLYAPEWRDTVRAGVINSAAVIAPLIVDLFDPKTVVDVGSGEGWFVNAFRTLDVHAEGIDGPWTKADHTADFSKGQFPDLPQADVVISLEVAEHLPPRRAEQFVGWLCQLAPTVVFSAAIPKQGGPGHVNEQPPEYWAEKFAAYGYPGSGALRWRIWNDDRVEPWYRQNLLVFGDHRLPVDGCPYVVHPDIWKLYRSPRAGTRSRSR